MQKLYAWGAFIGRVMLGSIFIISGMARIGEWNPSILYLTDVGVPLASVLLGVGLAVQFVAAACVILGFRARVAAAVLAVLLIPATLVFHPYWMFEAGALQEMQALLFIKNVAILGGLLLVASLGPGRIAVDRARPEAAQPPPPVKEPVGV